MGIGLFDFQGLWKRRRVFPVVFSRDRHFLGPLPEPLVLGGEPQLVEQLAFGLLHTTCRVCIAEGSGDTLQGVDAEPLTQILCWFIQSEQDLQRSLVALVTDAFTALLIDLHFGLCAGAMIVQIRIQVLPIEFVDPVGMGRIDVSVADVFADHRAVLGLYQAVVATLPGAAFGLLDAQFIEQPGDGGVDKLAAVVGVEAANRKGNWRNIASSTGSR